MKYYISEIRAGISDNEKTVKSGKTSPSLSFPEGSNQTVFMPAFFPPFISDERLSPIITVSSDEKSGIFEKQASKNSLFGLSKPTLWEIKIFSKYFAIPELFILPS